MVRFQVKGILKTIFTTGVLSLERIDRLILHLLSLCSHLITPFDGPDWEPVVANPPFEIGEKADTNVVESESSSKILLDVFSRDEREDESEYTLQNLNKIFLIESQR